MSIQVRDNSQKESSGFSAGGITLPDLTPKSSKIVIDTGNKNMDKKKDDKIDKKKEVKLFYEWLEESVKEGIDNRSEVLLHCQRPCPIACVCVMLGEPVTADGIGGYCCCTEHYDMIGSLLHRIDFIKEPITYCVDCYGDLTGHPGGLLGELMYSTHLATYHRHSIAEVAHILKTQLYENKKAKPKELWKPQDRMIDGQFRRPLGSDRIYVKNSFGTISDIRIGDLDLSFETEVLRPSLDFIEDDEK